MIKFYTGIEESTKKAAEVLEKLVYPIPEGLSLREIEIVAGHSTPMNTEEHDFIGVKVNCYSPYLKGAKRSEEYSIFTEEIYLVAEAIKPHLPEGWYIQDLEILPDYGQAMFSYNKGTCFWVQCMPERSK